MKTIDIRFGKTVAKSFYKRWVGGWMVLKMSKKEKLIEPKEENSELASLKKQKPEPKTLKNPTHPEDFSFVGIRKFAGNLQREIIEDRLGGYSSVKDEDLAEVANVAWDATKHCQTIMADAKNKPDAIKKCIDIVAEFKNKIETRLPLNSLEEVSEVKNTAEAEATGNPEPTKKPKK